MRCVVQKYGGSSVADLDKIRAVADRIAATKAQGYEVVAVASAMGNTTNELLDLAFQVSDAPARRELDMLVSVGERISVALLAMELEERGIRARSFTGSQSGIITDEAHANAAVVAVRPDRLRACLEQGIVAVVAGFQGVSRAREVTTLGRGGSDTTAVVLAAALQAEYCEICSDVNGVWSADPRVVPEAQQLEQLTLDDGLALARGGAKVLFEDAVRYARDRGVEIKASSTFGPGAGTRLVVGEVDLRTGRAVTGDAKLCRVVGGDGDTAASVRAQGGRIRRSIGATWYVDIRNVHGPLRLDGSGQNEGPAALVTAVGSGLGEDVGLASTLTASLRGQDVEVLAHGSEADTLWWEVSPERLNDAVRWVHAAVVA